MANLGWIQMVLPVFLTIACCLSIFSVSYCQFVQFPKEIGAGILLPKQVEIGFWGHSGYQYWTDNGENIWQVEVCYSFSERAETELDGTFEAARVFAILTPIFGIITSIFVCGAGSLSGGVNKLLVISLLLTTLFSGLSLLVFSSNVCNTKNWKELNVAEQSCKLSGGSIVAIVNTILYFLSAVMLYLYCSSTDGDEKYAPGNEAEDQAAKEGDVEGGAEEGENNDAAADNKE